MQELLADPLYRRHLEAHGRRQCVLLGYSDSNQEGGTCASRFAIYQAQRDLAAVLRAAGVQHVLFHARGGSVARGGGRIEAIVKAAPAGAINGVLRIREQGETIKQGYGLRPIAMRTLERAFNALSLTSAALRRGELAPDAPEHLAMRRAISASESRSAYRRLIYGEARFYQYFEAVTPIDVIERMQIGARSVHRAEQAGHRGAAAGAMGIRLVADRGTCFPAGTEPAPVLRRWCDKSGCRACARPMLVGFSCAI